MAPICHHTAVYYKFSIPVVHFVRENHHKIASFLSQLKIKFLCYNANDYTRMIARDVLHVQFKFNKNYNLEFTYF
jgi:hypothetical protein